MMSQSDELRINEFSPSSSGGGTERPSQPLRLSQPPSGRGFKEIGVTTLVRQLGLSEEQTNGHWCSRCQGIWYGYTLETECPACGNRRG